MALDNTYTALPTDATTLIVDGRYGKVHIHAVANWDGTTQTRYTAELLNADGRVTNAAYAETSPVSALIAIYLGQPRPRTNNIDKDIEVLQSRHAEGREDFAGAYTLKATKDVKGKVNHASGRMSLAPADSRVGMHGGMLILGITDVPVEIDPMTALRQLDKVIVLGRRADGSVDSCPNSVPWSAIASQPQGSIVRLPQVSA